MKILSLNTDPHADISLKVIKEEKRKEGWYGIRCDFCSQTEGSAVRGERYHSEKETKRKFLKKHWYSSSELFTIQTDKEFRKIYSEICFDCIKQLAKLIE